MSLGIFGALAAMSPRTAEAQEANGFGEKGELIITADRLIPVLSYGSTSVTHNQAGGSVKTTEAGTSVALLLGHEPGLGIVHTLPRVAIDYAVINHLTIGGSFALAFGLSGTREEQVSANNTRSTDTPRTTVVGFAPRVGYVIPLGRNFAFWPRAGLAFYSVSTKTTTANQNQTVTTDTVTDTVWSLDLDPQFVWVPIQHFFFHFGPILNIPFTGTESREQANANNTQTTKDDLSVFHFGINAAIGGWFDL
jgi:hypothetical protein